MSDELHPEYKFDYQQAQPNQFAMTDDQQFQRGFESLTFPAENWHHREHVKIAYIYLRQFPFDEALSRVRAGIQALNASQNVPDEPGRGYHETMTQAWLRLVHCTLCEFGPTETADVFVDTHAQLLSKRALLLFYSRDKLLSAEAKRTFVEPDLTPLPVSGKLNAALHYSQADRVGLHGEERVASERG